MSKKIPSLINWEILKKISNTESDSKNKKEPLYDKQGNRLVVTDAGGREFSPRKGLEGPFKTKKGGHNGVYYYDPKEGKFYCPYTDMYLEGEPGSDGSNKKSSTIEDLNSFKIACKIGSNKVEGLLISDSLDGALSKFKKIAEINGIDYRNIHVEIEPTKIEILELLKTALRRNTSQLTLEEVARRVVEGKMSGNLEDMPAGEASKVSQLISKLDILVQVVSDIVGRELKPEEVIDALSNAAKGSGATLEVGKDLESNPETYLTFDKEKLKSIASDSSMSKEAKKAKKKSGSKRKPTKPELWSRAKSKAKAKFDVYPSAYANLWASKWYKEHGGGWRKSSK